MEKSNVEQSKVVGNKENIINVSDNVENQKNKNQGKSLLTPYQKYKLSKNQNGKKYFEFYNDVKVYTHNIYDW